MTPQTGASVYRFRECVALHTTCSTDGEVETSPTIYLPPKLARELGEQLIAGADDIDSGTPFHLSEFGDAKLGDHQ